MSKRESLSGILRGGFEEAIAYNKVLVTIAKVNVEYTEDRISAKEAMERIHTILAEFTVPK